MQVTEAYSTLSDAESRRSYDIHGRQGATGGFNQGDARMTPTFFSPLAKMLPPKRQGTWVPVASVGGRLGEDITEVEALQQQAGTHPDKVELCC